MKVDFQADAKHGIAYVELTQGVDRTGIAKRTVSFESLKSSGSINLDFDENGMAVGIELLNFEFRQVTE
jgi:uncharacterized protein YuzE